MAVRKEVLRAAGDHDAGAAGGGRVDALEMRGDGRRLHPQRQLVEAIEQEREVAISDLLEKNSFRLINSVGGPYQLTLGLEENRLVMDLRLQDGAPHARVMLSLTPFRKVVKDYFLICESYYKAIRTAPPHQIEDLLDARADDDGKLRLGDLVHHAALALADARKGDDLALVRDGGKRAAVQSLQAFGVLERRGQRASDVGGDASAA